MLFDIDIDTDKYFYQQTVKQLIRSFEEKLEIKVKNAKSEVIFSHILLIYSLFIVVCSSLNKNLCGCSKSSFGIRTGLRTVFLFNFTILKSM